MSNILQFMRKLIKNLGNIFLVHIDIAQTFLKAWKASSLVTYLLAIICETPQLPVHNFMKRTPQHLKDQLDPQTIIGPLPSYSQQ